MEQGGEANFCLPEIQWQRRPNNFSPKPLNKRHPLSRMSPSCPECDSVSPEGPQVGIDQIKYLKISKYLAYLFINKISCLLVKSKCHT